MKLILKCFLIGFLTVAIIAGIIYLAVNVQIAGTIILYVVVALVGAFICALVGVVVMALILLIKD